MFRGNSDRHSIVSYTLLKPFTAQYVRIHPKGWRSHISMRAELYGCQKGTNSMLKSPHWYKILNVIYTEVSLKISVLGRNIGFFDPFRYYSRDRFMTFEGCFTAETNIFPFVYVLLHWAWRKYHKIKVETLLLGRCFLFFLFLFFNMAWPCTCEGKFCFSHLTNCDSDMICQFFCSLFVVTRNDVDGCLNLVPSEITTTCIW